MQERITKNLFSKVDTIFIINRAVTILGIAAWTAFVAHQQVNLDLARFLLGGFALHLVLFYLLAQRKFVSRDLLYRVTLFFDLAFITTLVWATGGLESDFYLLYYLAISFGAFYPGLRFGFLVSAFATAFYVAANIPTFEQIFLGDLAIRVSFFWFFAVAVGIISRYLKGSEERL